MRIAMKRTSGLVVFVLALVSAGCGNFGRPPPASGFFDLGLAEPVEPALKVAPTRIEVRAPSWLASAAMQYRIDYRPPARREAYSETRWASAPAEMLRLALERALTTNNSAGNGECRLRLDLDEFVQVFDTAGSSHASIVARADLLGPKSDVPVARRTIVIREPAPTPDAAGGVLAHRRGVQQLASALSTWLAGLDPAEIPGLNTRGPCGR